MLKIPAKKLKPDFDFLADVLRGSKQSDRVLLFEVLIDDEIQKKIIEDYFNEEYFPPPVSHWGTDIVQSSDFNDKKPYYEKYYRQTFNFYFRMGYSLYADLNFLNNFESLSALENKTRDTANLTKGDRHWAIEGTGMIKSWEDFENFPWDRANGMIDEYLQLLEVVGVFLPEGMKLGIGGSLFEEALEWIFGYEGLFYMLADDPALVDAVYEKVGKIMHDLYAATIQLDIVGCLLHFDDLGYKTATMLSPGDLERLIFSWMKKYASIAHEHDKPFYFHSCGNRDKIMDTLIDNVGIDAIHSFEDVSYPVIREKRRWGDRVGIIGGVDIDKLIRLDEQSLRKYVRDMLDECMPDGRYVFGSGNSIAKYVPVEKYLIMNDEALKWKN